MAVAIGTEQVFSNRHGAFYYVVHIEIPVTAQAPAHHQPGHRFGASAIFFIDVPVLRRGHRVLELIGVLRSERVFFSDDCAPSFAALIRGH